MKKKSWLSIAAMGAMGLLVVSPAPAEILVHFDQPSYSVTQGQTLEAQVILDADDLVEGLQSLTNGLASMSFEVSFDHTGLSVQGVGLPASLTNNGLNGPPRIELDTPGRASVRAAVYFLSDEFYLGEEPGGDPKRMRLATVELTGDTLGEFNLGLALWQPPGAADEGFVDGQRNILDGNIRYSGATVRVVPEPSTLVCMVAGAWWCGRRTRPASVI